LNFIIYDLEATCWEGKTPDGLTQETIEIGAVKINSYGEQVGSYNRFIRPVVHPYLSPFCKSLTSITQDDVDRSMRFEEVCQEFMEWADIENEDYYFCSWGSFDQKQLINDCIRNDMDYDWLDNYINLKKQYRDIKKLNKPVGLKAAVKKEGFEFTGIHHRGISDAENLAKIFLKHLDVWQY